MIIWKILLNIKCLCEHIPSGNHHHRHVSIATVAMEEDKSIFMAIMFRSYIACQHHFSLAVAVDS